MKKDYVFIFTLMVIVAYAARPLFGTRFIPTHDGEYHIIRFFEFYKELTVGHWFPRWASGLNSGYGLPLFIFHYPFPNYMGALFYTMGASFVDAFKLTMATGYISAVGFCWVWLHKKFSSYAAFVGTLVFATTPYWFVDLYVRGSVGEVVAIAFFMLAYAAVSRNWRTVLAVALAGIVISHNISGMMFFPLLFIYAIATKRMWISSWIMGIGLASYFWVPAMVESKYMVGLNTVNFREHFPDLIQLILPSWGTGFSQVGVPYGEMSQQIGVITIVVVCIATWYMLKRKTDKTVSFFLACFVGAVFLLSSFSLFIWEVVRPLSLAQFPWRLLAVLMPIGAYLAAFVVSKNKRWYVGFAISFLAILFSFSYMRPVTYEPRADAHYLTKPEFTDGTSSLGNSFSTIWTGWKKDRPDKAWEQKGDVRTFSTLYYPGWEAWVDGAPVAVTEHEGAIRVVALSGARVTLFFSETLVRALANAVSLVSLFWLLGSSILNVYAHRYRRTTA